MSNLREKRKLGDKLNETIGLWRSLLIYHGIPFRKRRITRFYSQFIAPGDLCFDIGAHVGNRLRPWTTLGARVVAVEPQPQLMNFLKRRFGHDSDIILLEEAVGAAPGSASMHISTRNPTVTSLSPVWMRDVGQDPSFSRVRWDRQLVVSVTSLDALIERYGLPALCKIDVEGYELQVLRGLSFAVPTLSFEYIPAAASLAEDCIRELARIGDYVFNWSTGENYRWESESWLQDKAMIGLLHGKLRHGRSSDIYARLRSPLTNNNS